MCIICFTAVSTIVSAGACRCCVRGCAHLVPDCCIPAGLLLLAWHSQDPTPATGHAHGSRHCQLRRCANSFQCFASPG